MLTGAVVPGTAGMRGFDCNQTVSRADAEKFYSAGYRFAVRYVRRDARHSFDLTEQEGTDILAAGLGLMVVQHVAPDGWMPTGEAGQMYGATAAAEAKNAGVPPFVTVWLDLEGVVPSAPAQWVIEYCNRWYSEVSAAGFTPGIYVGWHCRLNAIQLHDSLRFKSYWGAYNTDTVPALRGFQMKQSSIRGADKVQGVPWFNTDSSDVDTVTGDALGGFPSILMPECA